MEEQPDEWCVSAASVWEMAIKAVCGRLMLPAPVPAYIGARVRDGLRVLSVDWTHAAAVESLPGHHADPFDRLIIAQAKTEGLTVITGDDVFSDYGVKVIW